MPSNTGEVNDELSNDYVAQVLAKEARDSSTKYSAQGLGAYLPKRYDLRCGVRYIQNGVDVNRLADLQVQLLNRIRGFYEIS
jgi:hypothetical protein